METFSPTSALSSVDLPTLGRPTSAAKPARNAGDCLPVSCSAMEFQRTQRCLCGGLFGPPSARSFAFGFDACLWHGAGDQEGLLVRLAGGAFYRIRGQRLPIGLQMFLQPCLGVLE